MDLSTSLVIITKKKNTALSSFDPLSSLINHAYFYCFSSFFQSSWRFYIRKKHALYLKMPLVRESRKIINIWILFVFWKTIQSFKDVMILTSEIWCFYAFIIIIILSLDSPSQKRLLSVCALRGTKFSFIKILLVLSMQSLEFVSFSLLENSKCD